MADTLRIKRRLAGGAAGAPSSLAAAELAYNEQDDTLYYGKGNSGGLATSIVAIAGSGAFQPKDADLTALAAISGTGIYYRSAADTWSPVTIGTGLSFSGGVLSATASGGNVSNVPTPSNQQLAVWTGANTIKGDANLYWTGGGLYVNAAAFNVVGSANPAIYLGKTASGGGNYIVGMTANVPRWQMQLGDAAAEGTGTGGSDFSLMRCNNSGALIDYPISVSRADGSVNIGNGTLRAYPSQLRTYLVNSLTIGNPGTWLGWGLELVSTNTSGAAFGQEIFSNDANCAQYFIDKSRGASLNTYAAVQNNDYLGAIIFRGSDATAMRVGAAIYCIAQGAANSTGVPSLLQFNIGNASGAAVASIYARGTGVEILGVTDGRNAPSGFVGEFLSVGPGGNWGPLGQSVWYASQSLTLPAGDWDVWGQMYMTNGVGANYHAYATISLSSTGYDGRCISLIMSGPGGDYYASLAGFRVNSSGSTTVYILGYSIDYNGFYITGSYIFARRVH